MKTKALIMLIEDEKGISNFLDAILTSNDYQIIRCPHGNEVPALIRSHRPQLILLDLGLPDIDGLEVLRLIRSWSDVPILVLTARSNDADKVKAFALGADDYITKPFGTMELLARIKTALRHHQRQLNDIETEQINIGQLSINLLNQQVFLEQQEVHLTPIEYKIIAKLARNKGRVVTLADLGVEIWGPYTIDENNIRVNMANIRRKIEKNPADPHYILTEIGIGYRMVEEVKND
ncbi:Transcriptional regulatory protein KdpE [bioreactor metagenome]|uniref:Transcriptional regulatory protein KdpE n=1 Tax=bioreactor metagenome TaxID=1076179 RepID=A0A645AXB2_9ZZZZ